MDENYYGDDQFKHAASEQHEKVRVIRILYVEIVSGYMNLFSVLVARVLLLLVQISTLLAFSCMLLLLLQKIPVLVLHRLR